MNHVLQQQPSVRQRMQSHAGRQVRLVVAPPFGRPVHSDARIDNDGFLSLTTAGPPAVVLTLTPSLGAAFAFLQAGSAGVGSHIRIEGDVLLAAAIGQVAQSLRWDVEEDLSRVIGDVAAHRLGRLARGLREGAEGFRDRAREALQRGATADDGPLLARDQLAEFARDTAALAARVARLEAGTSRR